MRLNKLAAFLFIFLPLACAAAAKADSFSVGEFVTYDQGNWGNGAKSLGDELLYADYASVYAPESDVLTVGVVGNPGQYYLAFTNATAVSYGVLSGGTPGPLTYSLTNPGNLVNSDGGIFGGEVVALELNVSFSNAGLLGGTSSIPFGDLILTNFTGSLSTQELNGLTVNQFLGIANTCLSGGSCPYGVGNINSITAALNGSFESGDYVSPFADTNLALPSSGPLAHAGTIQPAASGARAGRPRAASPSHEA